MSIREKGYIPISLKVKYKPTLTTLEITIISKRFLGENEEELSSLLGCTSYSLISRVFTSILTVAVNFFNSTSTV